MRALGLMSGTSLDGIDVADVVVTHEGGRIAARLLNFATTPLGPQLRKSLLQSLPPHTVDAACIAELNVALGEAFASAVLRSANLWKVDLLQIDVIGSHGQTLYHAPEDGVTMQIGEAAIIAARTGITCVADFRSADVAAGGQGAPLVPFFDRELLCSDTEYRVALNIGGIANLTLLPPGCARESVRAFDTGPGCMVIDECARRATGGERLFDEDGAIAARGYVHAKLLDELLSEPYFSRKGPKTTGRERFGTEYAARVWDRGRSLGLSAEDVLATVTALTAQTIAAAVPRECSRVVVSGGGTRNRTLTAMLSASIAPTILEPSDVYGIPADAKEAMAFALLACEALGGRVNQLPGCTGARSTMVLGKMVPGANFGRLMRALWNGDRG